MEENEQEQNERTILLQRLLSRKDAIVQASQELERVHTQYLNAGKKDEDHQLSERVWIQIYTIVSCLSELNAYAAHKLDMLALNNILQKSSRHNWLLTTDFMPRFIALAANSVSVKWDLKKGPVVNFGELNVLNLQAKLGNLLGR